jgi:hypothetical protein
MAMWVVTVSRAVMKSMEPSQRIRVLSSTSAFGRSWDVVVDDEPHASYSDGSKSRALEWALRLAEDLRMSGAVIVEVEPDAGERNTRRVVRGRIAS